MEEIVDYLHGDWSDMHSNQKQKTLTQICANMAKLNELMQWVNGQSKTELGIAEITEKELIRITRELKAEKIGTTGYCVPKKERERKE